MNTIAQLLMLLIIGLSPQEETPVGVWHGTINVEGTDLRIVFHVIKNYDEYRSTLDSPDQSVRSIPISITSFMNSKVTLKISAINAAYEGTLLGNEITEQRVQSGTSFPLVLIKRI